MLEFIFGLPYRFLPESVSRESPWSLEKRFPFFYTIKVSARRLGLKTTDLPLVAFFFYYPLFLTINTKPPIAADYRRTGECYVSLCHEGGGCLIRNAGSEKDHKIPILNPKSWGLKGREPIVEDDEPEKQDSRQNTYENEKKNHEKTRQKYTYIFEYNYFSLHVTWSYHRVESVLFLGILVQALPWIKPDW